MKLVRGQNEALQLLPLPRPLGESEAQLQLSRGTSGWGMKFGWAGDPSPHLLGYISLQREILNVLVVKSGRWRRAGRGTKVALGMRGPWVVGSSSLSARTDTQVPLLNTRTKATVLSRLGDGASLL